MLPHPMFFYFFYFLLWTWEGCFFKDTLLTKTKTKRLTFFSAFFHRKFPLNRNDVTIWWRSATDTSDVINIKRTAATCFALRQRSTATPASLTGVTACLAVKVPYVTFVETACDDVTTTLLSPWCDLTSARLGNSCVMKYSSSFILVSNIHIIWTLTLSVSPWYSRIGWLGAYHRVTHWHF